MAVMACTNHHYGLVNGSMHSFIFYVMTKNSESPAPTINGQSVQEDVIENCFISKQTWNFLSCVLSLQDLYGKVEDALSEMYGEEQLSGLMDAYHEKSKEMETILYGFVNGSINDNISVISFNRI
jgi:hypothetical protein